MINRHAHTEYLKMIEVYSPFGIWHLFLYSISTKYYHFHLWSTRNMRIYQQIDVYIYQCEKATFVKTKQQKKTVTWPEEADYWLSCIWCFLVIRHFHIWYIGTGVALDWMIPNLYFDWTLLLKFFKCQRIIDSLGLIRLFFLIPRTLL